MNFNVNVKIDVNELIEQLKENELINECTGLLADGVRGLRYTTPKAIAFVGDYVRKKVRKENRIAPDPRILKEVLENIAFITDEELREMYLNLLASSCDSTKNNLAHPAYALILTQLNRDEASMIKDLAEKYIFIDNGSFYNKEIITYTSPSFIEDDEIKKLENGNIAFTNIEHMKSMGLIISGKAIGSGMELRGRCVSIVMLNHFGLGFAQACIPSISSSSSSEE